MNNKYMLAMLFSTVATLSGCGGGGDAPQPAPPPAATDAIPGTASASTLGLKDYLVNLSKDLPEAKEALDVSSFTPMTADDTEPEAVN